jgi:predicted nucleic acid-binding protein
MKFLLDTNVFREIGKTKPDANVASWLNSVDDADLAISALTVKEVRKGIVRLAAKKPGIADQIEARVAGAFNAFGERILPITREVADLWGQLLADSEKHVDDTGMIATAMVYGLILVTRNLKHVSGRGAPTLDPFSKAPKTIRA